MNLSAHLGWTQKFLITSKTISVYRSEHTRARRCVWQAATLRGFASTFVFLFRIAFVLLCFCTRWNISERASNLFRCLISVDCRQISQSASSSICNLREKQRTHSTYTHTEKERKSIFRHRAHGMRQVWCTSWHLRDAMYHLRLHNLRSNIIINLQLIFNWLTRGFALIYPRPGWWRLIVKCDCWRNTGLENTISHSIRFRIRILILCF